ncbi:polysaccharide lyase family 14 protein [Sparassis crispa]|uniref:Polysaccharide lyase family 14 protein n=1 Tax=Sparassis crispa TaxID=139825 RepID=A0A401H3D6_9APHY|nr:polysaccharide lyase family 14 protein [Sparassis crispa]GBE88921.1 polysaccharide lyase family 14 protein [Sparassis crispa]
MFCLPFFLANAIGFAAAQTSSASAIASQYSLSTSTKLPMPTKTMASSSATSFVKASWAATGVDGAPNMAFVPDPFPTATASPVLRVTYPSGSYSHPNTAGAQFYSHWEAPSGTKWHSMLLSYEVAFDSGFTWVKGGKLPGLRGGTDTADCSGGHIANGSNCFSSRLMWRTNGAGEVYAYFLLPEGLCNDPDFICNADNYGTSIDRGSFSWNSGEWSKVTLLVRLNNPVDNANGQVTLYHDDVEALHESNLQYRNSSVVDIGGLFFSTFFGRSTSDWAPPSDMHAYFRNFEMWAASVAV